jgi:hypothetical protein
MTRHTPRFLFIVLMFGLMSLYLLPIACSGVDCKDPKNGSSASCVVETTLLECAGNDVAGAIVQYSPAVEDIVKKGQNPDGSINYQAIEGDLITAIAKYGWCVVSSVFEHYMNPGAAGSGTKLAGPVPTPAAATDTFNRLRAKVAPSLKIHTTHSTI